MVVSLTTQETQKQQSRGKKLVSSIYTRRIWQVYPISRWMEVPDKPNCLEPRGGVWIGDDSQADPLKWKHQIHALQGLGWGWVAIQWFPASPELYNNQVQNRSKQCSEKLKWLHTMPEDRGGWTKTRVLRSRILKMQLVNGQHYQHHLGVPNSQAPSQTC